MATTFSNKSSGMKRVRITISRRGSTAKEAFKEIEKLAAQKRAGDVRRRIIASAHYVRDHIIDAAPRESFKKLLLGMPVEKYEHYNSGFDMNISAGGQVSFYLMLSTGRFNKNKFQGYNPVWGLLVSAYGRKAIVASDPKHPIPIPVNLLAANGREYNHPKFGTGWGNRFAGMGVIFRKSVAAVEGTDWIDNAVKNAKTHAMRILGGKRYKGYKAQESWWGE